MRGLLVLWRVLRCRSLLAAGGLPFAAHSQARAVKLASTVSPVSLLLLAVTAPRLYARAVRGWLRAQLLSVRFLLLACSARSRGAAVSLDGQYPLGLSSCGSACQPEPRNSLSWESWAEELALGELFGDEGAGTDAADDDLPEKLERNTECHPRKLLGLHKQPPPPPPLPEAGAQCGTRSDSRGDVPAPSLQREAPRTASKPSKKKFYAVAAGWRVGIFSKSREWRASTDGYKGAKAKAFRTRAEAEEFLRRHTDPGVKHKGPAELRRRGSRILRAEADDYAADINPATARPGAASLWGEPDDAWASAWVGSPEPSSLTAAWSLEPVGDCPDEPAEHPKEWSCSQVVSLCPSLSLSVSLSDGAVRRWSRGYAHAACRARSQLSLRNMSWKAKTCCAWRRPSCGTSV